MRRRHVTSIAALLLSASTVGLVACSEDSNGANSDSNQTSTTAASSTAPSTEPTTTTSTGESAAVTSTSVAPSEKRFLTAVNVKSEGGVDIVEFTFTEATPGYSIGYQTESFTDEGAGKPISVSGAHKTKVVLESSATVDLTGGLKTYYSGPTRIAAPTQSNLTEVVKVSEYEGRLVWAIGSKTEKPFRVTAQDNKLEIRFS